VFFILYFQGQSVHVLAANKARNSCDSSKVNDKKKSSSNDISNVLFSRAKCSKVNNRKLKNSSNEISNVLFSRAKCSKVNDR
jgi:hypothetical protein